MIENRLLKTAFKPNTEAVTGGWTKSYENLQNLYSSANIVSMSNLGEIERTCMGDIINRSSPERLMRKWEDNIKVAPS
jgi:hypothetical protein